MIGSVGEEENGQTRREDVDTQTDRQIHRQTHPPTFRVNNPNDP